MRFRRCAVLIAFGIVAAFVHLTASAHAILVDSTPQINGSVPAGHVVLMLKYNSKIDQVRSQLVLVGPDHKETTLVITGQSNKPNVLDSEAELSPGDYVIRWQALALDGHLTRGNLPFTVTAKP